MTILFLSHNSESHAADYIKDWSACRLNCCWSSPAQSFLVSGPVGLMIILFLSHNSESHAADHIKEWSACRLNYCWASPAQSFLVSGLVETFDQDIFFSPRHVRYWEMRRGSVFLWSKLLHDLATSPVRLTTRYLFFPFQRSKTNVMFVTFFDDQGIIYN
jgi:hypothetical protein